MHKQNFIKINSLFLKIEILTSFKGHNSVSVNFNVLVTILYTQNFIKLQKFDRNPQNNSKDIEHKHNSDVDQGQ